MAQNDETLTDEQYNTFRHWLVASDNLETYLNRALAFFGLSMTEYRMLVVLSEAPGSRLRMSDLANDAYHSLSRSSHTIARMETRGWVQRTPYDGDRRVTYVALTPEGVALYERAKPHHQAAIRRVFVEAVGPDQIPAFDATMQRLIAAASAPR